MTEHINGKCSSIAVLPFSVSGGDPATEYLGDGIAESITDRLRRGLPDLRVVPRSLAFRFRGPEVDFDIVARELSVDAVITGRVIQQGDRIVVRPELIRLVDRRQLWGHRFDEQRTEILQVEVTIATKIAEALLPALSGKQRAQLAQNETDDPDAHLAYLNGRFWWRQHWPRANRRALPFFEDAIAADPSFALAYAGIADIYSTPAGDYSYEIARTRAEEALGMALKLDDSRVEVQTAHGLFNMAHEWDWIAAKRNYQRALATDPDFGWAHHVYGHLLTVLNQNDEARVHFERALQLEPESTDNLVCLGGHYLIMGMDDAAERMLTDYRVTDTDFGLDLGSEYLGWLYLRQERYDEALAVFAHVVDKSNRSPFSISLLAIAEATRGNVPRARELLSELLKKPNTAHHSGVLLAPVYAALGDKDEAMRHLEESYESRQYTWLPVSLFRPGYDSLRADPRFHLLLRRMDLVPSVSATATD